MEDQLKKLNDLAIASGRKRMSPQTGYIHLHYHSLPEEVQYSIPVVENVLFALALFRTRTAENVTEAKNMIDQILAFQNPVEGTSYGNFPIYLHDYPQCKDWYLAVHLLAPFYWILKDFGQVLGADLKGRLEKSLVQALTHSVATYAEKGAPDFIAMKIGAALAVVGDFLDADDYTAEGQKMLEPFTSPSEMWFQPKYVGEMLTALQMLRPDFENSVWTPFWKHLQNTWHKETCTYAGPALGDLQQGEEPQVTLYDLFLGYFSGNYSARALRDSPIHLQAALIQPLQAAFQSPAYPYHQSGVLQGRPWTMHMNQKYAYALLEQQQPFEGAKDKGMYPLKILWGTPQRVHTFVNQGGNSSKIQFSTHADRISLTFSLSDVPEAEDREKSRELCFFTDLFPGTKILIQGQAATTFKIPEELAISMDHLNIALSLIPQGDGQYQGHIMRGNRPSQTAQKGEQRFAAFDWQIFLRTLRRTSPATLTVSLKIS